MSKTEKQVTLVRSPLVIIFTNDAGKIETHLHPPESYTYQHYGLLACDMVRHAALMYGVPEAAVWEWVDKERNRPTTDLETLREAFASTTRN